MVLQDVPSVLSRVSDLDKVRLLGDGQLHGDVDRAVVAAGRREKRKRRLSSVVTMHLVLALSLYRSLAIPNVFAVLLDALRDLIPGLPYRPASDGSICDARYRLGHLPLKLLFEARAAVMATPPTFHGLRVWAIDGVRFLIPDTPENEKEFGRPKPGRGHTAYPVALVVALVDVFQHLLRAVDIGPHDRAESAAVPDLVAHLGQQDLVLMDRYFPSARLFALFMQLRVNFLCRISSNWKPRIVRQLDDGGYLVKIPVPRPQFPEGWVSGTGPRKFVWLFLRMIVYTCSGTETIRCLTNLVLPDIPSLELARLYHERWEGECTYDELKNHFAAGLHGSADLHIRSKYPEGVRQEFYAMFTTYNFVRETIAAAATAHGLNPLDISFTDALCAIKLAIPRLAAATSESERRRILARLYRTIANDCRLRRRRRPRRYPRKVKIKMSSYHCKGPNDRQEIVDLVAQTKLLEPAPEQAKAS